MSARLWCLLALLCAVQPALADKNRARDLYREGTQHFKLAEYESALNAFKEAYRNHEDPSFLFNIAQCHRRLNQKEEAIRFFRTYLHDLPDAPNRVEVSLVITMLEESIAKEKAAQTGPPQDTISPKEPLPQPKSEQVVIARPVEGGPARTPIYKKWWLWTAVAGAVVVGVGVGLAVAYTTPNDAPSPPNTFGVSLH